jgi:hypothetical protein
LQVLEYVLNLILQWQQQNFGLIHHEGISHQSN